MIKVIEMPPSGERCILPEVFGEVAIMLRYAMQPLPPLPGVQEGESAESKGVEAGKASAVKAELLDSVEASKPSVTKADPSSEQQQQQTQGSESAVAKVNNSSAITATPSKTTTKSNPHTLRATTTTQGNPGVCQLLDVGLAPDAYWIVMPQYCCSLAQWRAAPVQLPPTQPAAVALYLAVLIQVCVVCVC